MLIGGGGKEKEEHTQSANQQKQPGSRGTEEEQEKTKKRTNVKASVVVKTAPRAESLDLHTLRRSRAESLEIETRPRLYTVSQSKITTKQKQ